MPTIKDKQAANAYINNPFTIVLKGMELLFKMATPVAILLVILTVFLAPSYGSTNTAPTTTNEPITTLGTPMLDATAMALIIAFVAVLAFGLLILGSFVTGIASYTAVELARGNQVTLKQAAKATLDRLWSFVWLQLLTGIKVLLWLLLFIVPGIIMAVRYSLANLSFFDEDKKYRGNAALQDSIALTKGAWTTTFGAQAFFNIITFGLIGLLIEVASKTVLYRQLSTAKKNGDEIPAPHWLSYAALALLVLIFTFVVSMLGYAIVNYSLSTVVR